MNEETTNNNPQTPNFDGEKMKMPENSSVTLKQPVEKNVATLPVLVVLAVLLVGILGGLYYWFSTLESSNTPVIAPTPIERPTEEENNEPESTTAEARTETMQTVSTSDEITAIEADLEATDIETLDAELEAIEAELNASI